MATTKNMLQLTPEEEEAACARALQLSTGAVLPMTLKVAIELGLLEILVKAGPAAALSPEEITAQLTTDNPGAAAMADRILRLLAANDIVGCAVETGSGGRRSRKYTMAPICKYLTANDEDGTIANLVLLHQDKVFLDIWHHVKDSVLDGGDPVKASLGMTSFDYQGKDPRFDKVFNDAMRGHSTIMVKNLLRTYAGFADIEKLVDVGGNVGATLGMITARHPHIKGINFDLPHVIAEAQPLPGVEHVGGDMFESVPSGDAIFLKWILHDWSDEHCAKLLKNCWNALPEKAGKVIVVECILPVVPQSDPTTKSIFQLDLCMSTYNIGGKERTEEEFQALAKDAGFAGFKALHMFADTWVMEVTK